MSNNTQVTQAALLVEHAPKIVELQNAASGLLRAAPAFFSDRLAGEYMTLRGDGIVAVDDAGLYAPKSDGAGATPGSMSYGRESYQIDLYRHSKIQLDNIQLRELERKSLDLPGNYLSRKMTVAASVHGWAFSQRLSSTGADRAFTVAATSTSSINFTAPTASLKAVLEEAEDFFFTAGASNAGGKLVCLCNRRVAVNLAKLLEISDTQTISGFTTSGSTLARQGMTRMPQVEAFLNNQTTLPAPIELVVDAQVVSVAGTRRQLLADDLYFVWVDESDPGSSFMSTPVYDYSGVLGGYDPATILQVTGGQIPIAQVYSGDVLDPPGRFWAIEQAFGVHFYGVGDAGTNRALGYRFPLVLT
jgi:hypothetical protein